MCICNAYNIWSEQVKFAGRQAKPYCSALTIMCWKYKLSVVISDLKEKLNKLKAKPFFFLQTPYGVLFMQYVCETTWCGRDTDLLTDPLCTQLWIKCFIGFQNVSITRSLDPWWFNGNSQFQSEWRGSQKGLKYWHVGLWSQHTMWRLWHL